MFLSFLDAQLSLSHPCHWEGAQQLWFLQRKTIQNEIGMESSYIFYTSSNVSAFGRYSPNETVPHPQMLWVKMLECAY